MDRKTLETFLKQHVKDALSKKSSGTCCAEYKKMVAMFNGYMQDGVKQGELVNLLKGLRYHVSMLHHHHHRELLNALLGLQLWATSQELREVALELVEHLAVTDSLFVSSGLDMIIGNAVPPPAAVAAEHPGPWLPSQDDLAVQNLVIGCLQKVMAHVPTGHRAVRDTFARTAPHPARSKEAHCMFMRAVLQLAESPSGASIRDGLLQVAVEHVLRMDVLIQWRFIVQQHTGQEAEEEASDEPEEDIFAMEAVGELHIHDCGGGAPGASATPRGGWEGGVGRAGGEGVGPAAAAGPRSRQAVLAAEAEERASSLEAADKLDSLMELLFAHLQLRCKGGRELEVYNAFMASFRSTMLGTYQAKFTPFIAFFICSKAPATLPQLFATFLSQLIQDRQQADIVRSAGAAYMASFLARARFVPREVVLEQLEQLLAWAARYAAEQDAADVQARARPLGVVVALPPLAEPDAEAMLWMRHQVWHAVVQAVLYVLCYHLQPILQEASPADGLRARTQQLLKGPLRFLLRHRLAPQAVCLPSVSQEFARQVRSSFPEAAADLLPPKEERQRSFRPLEMLFPFDPYLLTRSRTFLQLPQTYTQWRVDHPSAPPHAGAAPTAGGPGAAAAGQAAQRRAADAGEEEGPHGVSDDDSSSRSSRSSSSSSEEEEGSEGGSRRSDFRQLPMGFSPGSSPMLGASLGTASPRSVHMATSLGIGAGAGGGALGAVGAGAADGAAAATTSTTTFTCLGSGDAHLGRSGGGAGSSGDFPAGSDYLRSPHSIDMCSPVAADILGHARWRAPHAAHQHRHSALTLTSPAESIVPDQLHMTG